MEQKLYFFNFNLTYIYTYAPIFYIPVCKYVHMYVFSYYFFFPLCDKHNF